MHYRVIAQRRDSAMKGLVAAVARLAEKIGSPQDVVNLESIHDRYPEVKDLLRLEAVVDFVTRLERSLSVQDVETESVEKGDGTKEGTFRQSLSGKRKKAE